MAPTPVIPLPLRNALAALALRALEDEPARAAARWLVAPATTPEADVAAVLIDVGLADPPGTRLLDMYAAHAPHAREQATRTLAAVRAFGAGPVPADPVDRALLAAVALWQAGLFFEVHEVLEPHWARAKGKAREALQGLIQIAVAFHHLSHGNPRGARKLLAEGRMKLQASGDHLVRVDADALLAATAGWTEALAAQQRAPGDAVPALTLR